MTGKDVLIRLPFVRIAALIVKLIKLSKDGLTKSEGLDLLEDLAYIAFDVAQKLV